MNTARNILIIFLLIFITLELCFYLSGVIFVLLVWGAESLNFNAINPSIFNFPYRLWPTIFNYIEQRLEFPENYTTRLTVSLIIATITPIGILAISLWSVRNTLLVWRPFKKKEALHGDAKWATEKEIIKAGLRAKEGILLGKDKKGFLIASGYQHALLFAPTGSGKGVGFVIPNLLFWKQSAIVHDIKLENFGLTSGWRSKQGQEVYCWSPAEPDGISHCYNPLDWVSAKPGQMVDDVQKIANLLMPKQDFWVNEARSLFLGVVLYLLAVPEKIKSFGEVVRTLRSDDVVYNLAVVLDTMGKNIHPVGYMNIAAFLQKAEKERSGVISTLNSSLELWANPLIDTATATSDFNFMKIKKKLTTIYVGITPDNLTRLQPLMQVFYQQATEFLCRHLPRPDEPYGVLFMMDEFPSLGKMEQFQTGIAYFRGYNVRIFLIIQDTEQLKGIYEEAGMNSFLSNTTYRITFAANNIQTANLISQLIGNKTVKQESLNKPKFLDLNPSSRSLHVSDIQRALLLPQEVITLPREDQILLIESTSPIRSKKIVYYKDSFFKNKILKPIFVPTQDPFDPRVFSNTQKSAEKEQQLTENEAPSLEEELKALTTEGVDEKYSDEDLESSLEEDEDENEDEDEENYELELKKVPYRDISDEELLKEVSVEENDDDFLKKHTLS